MNYISIDGLKYIEIAVCVLVAGLVSMLAGAPLLYYNLKKRRILIAVGVFHFFASFTAQLGSQFLEISSISLRLSFWILVGSTLAAGVIGGAFGWFATSFHRVLIGMAAGWDIWLNFSSLIPIPVISSIGGLILAGIIGYMSFTYQTSFEIICASFIACALFFHGLYLIGLGSIGLASQSYSVSITTYIYHAGITCLSLTIVAFVFIAFYHYRTYRIHKDCFRESRKPRYESTRLYTQPYHKSHM